MADLKDLAEQYGVLKDKLNAQDFEPNDSIIASSLMHPQEAARRAKDAFMRSIDAAGGVPREILDESSVFPFGIAPSIDEQAQAGLDLAGLMQTGAMPFAPASAGGTLGTFIGKNARNWDAQAAKLAEEKLNAGADPAEVWREHLIGRMPDKTLFSEISDKEMSHVIPLNKWVNRENGQLMAPNISTAWDEAASTLTPNAPVRIKRLFEHDQLKNEYPYGFTKNYENQSIMDMPVFMQEKNNKSYGSLGDEDLTLNPSLLPKEARSTVLHELQHAIQNQEGWGKGGSPAEFELSDFSKSYWQNIYDKSNDQQSELLQSLLEKKKAGEIDNNDIRLQMESLANRNGRSIAETMLRRDKNPIESYKRLAGEAQARATQDRLDMDMAKRRENYPLAGGKLSDIPLEDLIYKYEGDGPSLAIKAYHGTPHLFDRFDMSKIGTGEGAQAYGHGLYFAENPLVAKTYMTAGVPVDEYQNKIFLKKYHADTAKLRGDKEKEAALLQEIEDMKAQKGGNLYETSIRWPNAEREAMDPLGEHHLLDWDQPLSEQSDYVRNKLKKSDFYKNANKAYKDQKQWYLDPSQKTGESFLKYMRSGYDDESASGIKDAEQYLKNLDIPGLKYLDATSRSTDKGTRNYVMFGDEYPEIIKRAGSLDELQEKYAQGGIVKAQDQNENLGKLAEMLGSALGGNYKILSKKVPARQLFTNGDSIREWGWDSRYAEGGEVDLSDDNGYADDLARLKRAYENSNFGPNDSVIASSIRHPAEALQRAGDWLQEKERILSGRPYEDDFTPEQQAQAALDLAGLAETGSMPFAPSSAGGTLGTVNIPEKTVNAYKLFRTKENDPDTLYPLFVNADKPVPMNEWVAAEAGAPATQNAYKVKSILGPLAYRPGWHAGDVPIATHIGKGGKPPVYRPFEHQWAEVEFPADVDWQTLANERGINKKGILIPKEAHITDQIPFGGFYRYKTSPNMTGEWLISGDMKVNKPISDAEVKAANFASGLGIEDLPRFHEYLSRNVDNPEELARVINSTAGKNEYFHMLKSAKDRELDDLLKQYEQFTDAKALKALDARYNKYLKKGYAKGGEVKALHDKYEESDYGYGDRPDKTKKGLGYFGELERPDGTGVMTEYSIGVPINGEEMDVPTLIPTLTPDEIRLILHMQDGEDMPRSIVHKAIDHAHQRLSEGKPIFATEEDLYAHGGIVDVLHNDAIEQIMKAFMDSMEDEQEEEEPAAVSIQITTHSQPLKSGKIPTSIREAKHG